MTGSSIVPFVALSGPGGGCVLIATSGQMIFPKLGMGALCVRVAGKTGNIFLVMIAGNWFHATTG
jgi:hypothetical protein